MEDRLFLYSANRFQSMTGTALERKKTERLQAFQTLIEYLQEAMSETAQTSREATRVSQLIFKALENNVGSVSRHKPIHLPACNHFSTALDTVRKGPSTLHRIADVLSEIGPMLAWRHPSVLKPSGDEAFGNIANAILIGPNGLERRNDVIIGMTIMAPHTLYPDHQHSPAEVYTVLSEGEWRQNEDDWHEPGLGGAVYNPSNIVHSFKSGSQPLLAIWCLWSG